MLVFKIPGFAQKSQTLVQIADIHNGQKLHVTSKKVAFCYRDYLATKLKIPTVEVLG